MQTTSYKLQVDISKACLKDDLRPEMGYVEFKNGWAYATDAYIMLKIDIGVLFGVTKITRNEEKRKELTERIANHLEGKYFHAQVIKKMYSEPVLLPIDDGCFLAPHSISDSGGGIVYKPETGIKFPNCEAAIEKPLFQKSLKAINVNINLLATAQKLFVWDIVKRLRCLVICRNGHRLESERPSQLILIPSSESLDNPKQMIILMQSINEQLQTKKLQS